MASSGSESGGVTAVVKLGAIVIVVFRYGRFSGRPFSERLLHHHLSFFFQRAFMRLISVFGRIL